MVALPNIPHTHADASTNALGEEEVPVLVAPAHGEEGEGEEYAAARDDRSKIASVKGLADQHADLPCVSSRCRRRGRAHEEEAEELDGAYHGDRAGGDGGQRGSVVRVVNAKDLKDAEGAE